MDIVQSFFHFFRGFMLCLPGWHAFSCHAENAIGGTGATALGNSLLHNSSLCTLDLSSEFSFLKQKEMNV